MNMRKLGLNKIKIFLKNFFLGILVGFSDLFPAISGSTILMIFGKYFELLKPINYLINSIYKLKKIDEKIREYFSTKAFKLARENEQYLDSLLDGE